MTDQGENPKTAKRKAIIYARFSPQPDGDTSQSCEYQLAECRKLVEAKGAEVADLGGRRAEFADHGMTGADDERPELWKALRALRRGWWLVLYSYDRLTRSERDRLSIIGIIEGKGAKILSVMEPMDGVPPDLKEYILGILGQKSQFERKMMNNRTRDAMRNYQQEGRAMSCKAPYGQVRGPDEIVQGRDGKWKTRRRWVHVPAEQAILKDILGLWRAGRGLRQIARELTTTGRLCRGRPWTHQTIKAILFRHAPAASLTGLTPPKPRRRKKKGNAWGAGAGTVLPSIIANDAPGYK